MPVPRQHVDIVVVSLYVNPTQFAANEDFGAYPRDEVRGLTLIDRPYLACTGIRHAQASEPWRDCHLQAIVIVRVGYDCTVTQLIGVHVRAMRSNRGGRRSAGGWC